MAEKLTSAVRVWLAVVPDEYLHQMQSTINGRWWRSPMLSPTAFAIEKRGLIEFARPDGRRLCWRRTEAGRAKLQESTDVS